MNPDDTIRSTNPDDTTHSANPDDEIRSVNSDDEIRRMNMNDGIRRVNLDDHRYSRSTDGRETCEGESIDSQVSTQHHIHESNIKKTVLPVRLIWVRDSQSTKWMT